MLSPERPDRIHVAFDDHRLVANAGLLLRVTLPSIRILDGFAYGVQHQPVAAGGTCSSTRSPVNGGGNWGVDAQAGHAVHFIAAVYI